MTVGHERVDPQPGDQANLDLWHLMYLQDPFPLVFRTTPS